MMMMVVSMMRMTMMVVSMSMTASAGMRVFVIFSHTLDKTQIQERSQRKTGHQMQTTCEQRKKLTLFAQTLFYYTLVVILWGAWVRISHSGDGCGDTWPLCGGKLIPEVERGKTWVEYGHRLMSGVYGILVFVFWLWGRRLLPKKSLAATAILLTFLFTISEALLGAKLVIFGLVTSNDTPFRAFVMALHQINSLLLTGSIAVAWLGLQANDSMLGKHAVKIKDFFSLRTLSILLFAITGAWASLSTTLFPSESLISGLMNDLSAESHYLVRLRILHPLLAVSLGLYFVWDYWTKSLSTETNELSKKISAQTAFAFLVAIAFGASTLLALSPTWMKLTHLGIAHLLWGMVLRWIFHSTLSKT